MVETEIIRLPIPRTVLSSLHAEERRLLVLFGQMANELQTFSRLLLFSLHDGPIEPEVSERIAGGRANILLRILCGKIWEAHELVRQRLLSSPNAKAYRDMLDEAGREKLSEIQRQAGGEAGRLLAALRNKHAFHFPTNADLDAAFDQIDAQEPLEFILSDNGDATFYHASEVFAQTAMIGVVEGNTNEERVAKLADVMLSSSRVLVSFAGHVTGAILQHRTNALDEQRDSEIVPATLLDEVSIPPITARRRN